MQNEYQFCHITHVKADSPSWVFATHCHENAEISIVIGGKGSTMLDGKTYTIQSGDIILKNAGIYHSERTDEKDLLEEICLEIEGFNDHKLVPDTIMPVIQAGAPYDFLLPFSVYIYNIWEKNKRDHDLPLFACTLVKAVQRMIQEKAELLSENAREQTVRDILVYINSHYHESLSLDQLSDLFYLSPSYIERQFKKMTGRTINQYLISCRIGEAQRLLAFDDMQINDIVKRCGFESIQYFYAVFKKETGISPAAYRRRMQK